MKNTTAAITAAITTTTVVLDSPAILSIKSRVKSATTKIERDALLTELQRVRAFEALVVKHGSEDAARAYIASIETQAIASRERELASMMGPNPARIFTRTDMVHDHRTSQGDNGDNQ
jgi:hypothetical protein